MFFLLGNFSDLWGMKSGYLEGLSRQPNGPSVGSTNLDSVVMCAASNNPS